MEGARELVVLYIGGEGRSGSTLVSAMIGQYPGIFAVGELRSVWRAVKTNEFCGCGVPFSECEFWVAVGKEAFGGWDHVDIHQMLDLDTNYARHRFVARLVVPALRRQRRHSRRLDKYGAVLLSLYQAVRDVSRCAVIVDSTKDPTYAFLLHRVPGLSLRVLHLVRDSRGVAYSWDKTGVVRPEYANHPTLSGTFMDRREPWRSALLWDAKNALFHWLGRSGVPRVLMRYESFVDDPAAGLQRALALVEGYAPEVGHAVSLSALNEFESLPHHTLGGNRIRFARGVVSLRADEEWRTAMERWPWLVVSALTLPFLVAYGYVGRAKRV